MLKIKKEKIVSSFRDSRQEAFEQNEKLGGDWDDEAALWCSLAKEDWTFEEREYATQVLGMPDVYCAPRSFLQWLDAL